MAATGDGATDFLSSDPNTITAPGAAYSYAFWFYALHTPDTGGASNPFSLSSGGGYTVRFNWDFTDTTANRAAVHATTGSPTIARLPADPAINVWNHYVVTWDGTNLKVYLNGFLKVTEAGSNPDTGLGDPIVNILAYNNGASAFMDGSVAHACVWNVALTAAEVLSVFTATVPTGVQNGAIVFYDSLNTSGTPSPIGPALVNTGCTIDESLFECMSGGLKLGGANTVSVYARNEVMLGGLSLGGSQTISTFAVTEAMTGGIAIGGSFPLVAPFTTGGPEIAIDRASAYTTK